MATYTIHQWVIHRITVEADSEAEAEAKAGETPLDQWDDADWQHTMIDGPEES